MKGGPPNRPQPTSEPFLQKNRWISYENRPKFAKKFRDRRHPKPFYKWKIANFLKKKIQNSQNFLQRPTPKKFLLAAPLMNYWNFWQKIESKFLRLCIRPRKTQKPLTSLHPNHLFYFFLFQGTVLKYVSLLVLVVQNTSQVLVMRYATTRDKHEHPPFLKTVGKLRKFQNFRISWISPWFREIYLFFV